MAVMAEFGAHLNQGTSAERPTIFEVVSQESMNSVLRPALVYGLKVVASSRPDSWGWLWRYSDELYTVIDLMVQNHYLKKFGGSFAENFYGMKRYFSPKTVEVKQPHAGILDYGDRISSLLTLVILPYCKLKFDVIFEKLRGEHVNDVPSHQSRNRSYFQKLKNMFIYIYPYLHFTWETAFLCYQLLYMLKVSDYHSPFLHLCGLRLKRLSRQDVFAHSLQSIPSLVKPISSWKKFLGELPQVVGNTLITLIANGIPLIVFFLKFVEWWYSSENSRSLVSAASLPIPPPPAQLEVSYTH